MKFVMVRDLKIINDLVRNVLRAEWLEIKSAKDKFTMSSDSLHKYDRHGSSKLSRDVYSYSPRLETKRAYFYSTR